MSTVINVPHCTTMSELRSHIDSLDERIVPLLAERTALVAQAARIKQAESQIRDLARVEFIVERVKRRAAALGAPESVVEAAYRALIEASIQHEHGEFARLHGED